MYCDPTKPLIIELDGVLTAAQCDQLIERIDSLEPTIAPINAAGGTAVRTDVRNNERAMFDDVVLAEQVFAAAKAQLPAQFGEWTIASANERFRCYRYRPGMRFAPHMDGSFARSESERSFYSYLVYLNDDFIGGETTFLVEPELAIVPRKGCGLLFQHPIVHEGSVVEVGTKYVARSDIMYRR